MEAFNEVDLNELCRICSNINGNSEHKLSEDDQPTKLGEMFQLCFDIELKVDIGYPNALCNYCQLQLSMFYAFVEKAKTSNSNFAQMIDSLNPPPQDRHQRSPPKRARRRKANENHIEISEAFTVKDDPFDMQIQEINDNAYEMEEEITENLIPAKLEIVEIDQSEIDIYPGDESDYSVEYLEPEFIDTFETEIKSQVIDPEMEEAIEKALKPNDKRKSIKRHYPYQCKLCPKRFVYKEVYDGHMRTHKGLPAFSCEHCPKTFSEKANFDYHMQDHTNYRPAKCPLCEKSFKNKQDLASHIRCHKDIRKYMCDVCGKRFRSQSHMAYHRYSHFEERNFHCDKCSQSFKSPHILKTHRNTVHSDFYKYECGVCGRKFKRDHHLVAHSRTHNKDPIKNDKKKRVNVEVKAEPDSYIEIETTETIVEI